VVAPKTLTASAAVKVFPAGIKILNDAMPAGPARERERQTARIELIALLQGPPTPPA
jgi:hypothetical protein